ncbi:DUF350 domain-containing protein [Candidatus Gracilibacteria bacterium]|nr:DUF350 domain-containing protein [Candidatus Gracilibacteria bacterium]
MDSLIITLLGGFLYLIVGVLLFIMNLALFEWWTPFDSKQALFRVQNKAIAEIIKGNLIGQGIIIGAVIFFTGYTPDHEFLQPAVFLPSVGLTIFFGMMGMFAQNFLLWCVMQIKPIEKELIVDKNEAVGTVLGALIIAFSIILSIAFYSY